MNKQELKIYLLEYKKNRLTKLATEMIAEFRTAPERWSALHEISICIDSHPYQEYASWLCGHLVEELYSGSNTYRIEEMTDSWLLTENQSVRRNLLKIILKVQPEHRNGEVLDRVLHYLGSPDEAIAIRSYSFSMLTSMLKDYPGLTHEIDAIVDAFPELFKMPALQSCLKRYSRLKEIPIIN